MSAERLERDLAELPDGGGPRRGWEARVLAMARMPAIERPQRRAPLALALAGAKSALDPAGILNPGVLLTPRSSS